MNGPPFAPNDAPPRHPQGRPIRIVTVGDVGHTSSFHVGDEAMTLALIEDAAKARAGIEWTVLSLQPAQAAQAFGVATAQSLSFRNCAGPAEREQRLAQLDAILANPPEEWTRHAPPEWRDALSSIVDCDAVIIAGGGNLSRTWPQHVFERVAMARAARRAGKPLAITGQTLGPSLDDRTRQLVRELLTDSVFNGLREAQSAALALELGGRPDRTFLQFDDAIGVSGVEPAGASAIVGDAPFIAVTLNRLADASDTAGIVPRLASELRSLHRATGAAVVLVPHVGNLDGTPSEDVLFGREIVAAAGSAGDVRLAPLPSIREAVWYCQRADIVVSTRYHPIVFAVGAATPSLFVSQDRYTLVKGQGALALAGLDAWTLPVSAAAMGLLAPAALDLWQQRDAVRRHLSRMSDALVQSRRGHIEALLTAVLSPGRVPAIAPIRPVQGPAPRGEWLNLAHDSLSLLTEMTERERLLRAVKQHDADRRLVEERAARAEEYVRSLAAAVERKERDLLIAHEAIHRLGPGPVAPAVAIHACTIVARNYLPYARVWAQSLKAIHPDAFVTVLVIDGDAAAADASSFRTVTFSDVVPDSDERVRQALMYDVTELSTAVKPALLTYLLKEGAPAVLYFDPDIEIFGSIAELAAQAAATGIVLTPHALSPIPDDGFGVTDIAVLSAGVFNLGFIGVGRQSDAFLAWWAGRLRRHCLSDLANGMFVDQRWLDYVPGMFPHVIVRDPGCNVAYWNLHERDLASSLDGITVNGAPLRFFHFSGFDAQTPGLLSRHQGPKPRVLLSEQPIVRQLSERYARALVAQNHGAVVGPYGFSTLPDGTPIDRTMRRVFRDAVIEAEAHGRPAPPSPFAWHEIVRWFQAPSSEAPRLSRYLLGLYRQRIDLQRAFPSLHGTAAEPYLNWVRADPWARRTIPDALRETVSTQPVDGEVRANFRSGLNIAGYFNAELGVGEVARLITSALSADGIPVSTVVNNQTLSRQRDRFLMSANGGPYSVTLVCANADETPRALDALPRAMIEDCHRIGFWFWETERLPHTHALSADHLDEIWVATDYVASAVRAAVSKPVYVCPLPVRVPQPAVRSRTHFGLPEGFLFLFAFDFLSSVDRKNPMGTIEAFRRAFRPGEGPTLVLKSINGECDRSALERVRTASRGRDDIITMDGYLSAEDRDALVQSCDCYVSLHRSEGFGLTLAEAMALGKPAIATGYSGNLAFMTPDNSFLVPWTAGRVPSGCAFYPPDEAWAEPDLDAAASVMRQVYGDPDLARERGRLGHESVTRDLAGTRTATFVRQRLRDIESGRQPASSAEAAAVPEALTPAAPDVPPQEPDVMSDETARLLAEDMAAAERDLDESHQLLVTGLPLQHPSRFGWPGRVLRTAVLRLIRPQTQLEVRAHERHVQALRRVMAGIRRSATSTERSTESRD
ncbi:MAG: polysaccharide pyruvyl transferase family protein [Acidobacteriota bacterium]